MPNRRDIIKSSFVAGTAAFFGSRPDRARANWGMPYPQAGFDGRSLINKPQAYRVLDEAGLDGLIAFNPINVFYLGNHLGYYVKIQHRNPSFAVFPRDEKKPTVLVVASADLWEIANGGREYPQVVPYSSPANWQEFVDQEPAATMPEPSPGVASISSPADVREITGMDAIPEAGPGFASIWPVNEAGLSPREADWVAIEARFKGRFAPTPEHALVKALKEAGLEKGKLAVDDLRVAHILESAGHDSSTCVEGDNLFRKIRVVKSDVEIGHMRRIAIANQTAAMNMLGQLEAGATNADIDRLFMVEAAKQGAMSTWFVAGTVGGLAQGEIVAGEPLLIDAVSQINYYHGDFGRTVVVGEPSKKLQERTRLLELGWQAAFAEMRPGVRYAEVQEAARRAMKRSGLTVPRIGVIPHSVGLQHTDEPYRDNLAFQVKDDLMLQENMTLTVDFPSMELGWGACHLEDLVRITKDGAEPLATMDDPLVVI